LSKQQLGKGNSTKQSTMQIKGQKEAKGNGNTDNTNLPQEKKVTGELTLADLTQEDR
jgi:hypothetical protein